MSPSKGNEIAYRAKAGCAWPSCDPLGYNRDREPMYYDQGFVGAAIEGLDMVVGAP